MKVGYVVDDVQATAELVHSTCVFLLRQAF
jgi:hypothetical protein